MAAPATEGLREIERELLIATEENRIVSFSELQERFELGHDDLSACLDVLRVHGKAVEAAPGDWRGPHDDEVAAAAAPPERVRVVAETPAEDGDRGDVQARALRRMDGPARGVQSAVGLDVAPHVRITRSIADALGAEALGQLVKAGIDDAEGVFVLEVSP